MRLRTIWTLRPMTLHERLVRTSEWFWRTAAHHAPKRLRYWVFIDVGANLIEPAEIVPEIHYTDLLARMDHR